MEDGECQIVTHAGSGHADTWTPVADVTIGLMRHQCSEENDGDLVCGNGLMFSIFQDEYCNFMSEHLRVEAT